MAYDVCVVGGGPGRAGRCPRRPPRAGSSWSLLEKDVRLGGALHYSGRTRLRRRHPGPGGQGDRRLRGGALGRHPADLDGHRARGPDPALRRVAAGHGGLAGGPRGRVGPHHAAARLRPRAVPHRPHGAHVADGACRSPRRWSGPLPPMSSRAGSRCGCPRPPPAWSWTGAGSRGSGPSPAMWSRPATPCWPPAASGTTPSCSAGTRRRRSSPRRPRGPPATGSSWPSRPAPRCRGRASTCRPSAGCRPSPASCGSTGCTARTWSPRSASPGRSTSTRRVGAGSTRRSRASTARSGCSSRSLR